MGAIKVSLRLDVTGEAPIGEGNQGNTRALHVSVAAQLMYGYSTWYIGSFIRNHDYWEWRKTQFCKGHQHDVTSSRGGLMCRTTASHCCVAACLSPVVLDIHLHHHLPGQDDASIKENLDYQPTD